MWFWITLNETLLAEKWNLCWDLLLMETPNPKIERAHVCECTKRYKEKGCTDKHVSKEEHSGRSMQNVSTANSFRFVFCLFNNQQHSIQHKHFWAVYSLCNYWQERMVIPVTITLMRVFLAFRVGNAWINFLLTWKCSYMGCSNFGFDWWIFKFNLILFISQTCESFGYILSWICFFFITCSVNCWSLSLFSISESSLHLWPITCFRILLGHGLRLNCDKILSQLCSGIGEKDV